MSRIVLGRYIVMDSEICHGKPTFAGTRIMVEQVLNQVGRGMAWEHIEAEWRGKVCREAIEEAVRMAGRAFNDHADEYKLESTPA